MARVRRLFATIERLGSGPMGLVRLAALVTVLLGSVLFQGLQIDDFWIRNFLLGHPRWSPAPRPWWAVFTFFSGNPVDMAWFREEGLVPWWADDHVRIVFFRPLSGLTHWIDFTLWPNAAGLMHLHSLAWYVALALVAALLFRRLLPPSASALAALLYAVDHTHGSVVGWLANRNSVIAAVFALAAVLFHDRAARGEPRARWIGALCLALGLLGGEAAVGAAAYLFAHAMTLDTRPWRERAKDLAPHVAVLAAWVVVYKLGGYGATGSALYVDPGRAPLRMLASVPERVTALAASEWGWFGPELLLLFPPAGRAVFIAIAALAVAASLHAVLPRLRARATTRFFLLGSALSLVPVCATVPATRLLLVPGFGLIGIVAEVLADAALPGAEPLRGLRRITIGWLAGWVGGAHLALSPILVGPMAWQMVLLQEQVLGWARSFPPDDAALARQRLVVVNIPDAVFAGYIAVSRDGHGMTVPRAMLPLAVGLHPVEVRRVSEAAVEVTAPGGFCQFITDFIERDPDVPLPVGTRYTLSDVTIEVVHATPAGVADVARFTFAGGPEDARFRWVKWEDRRYVPFALPAVGETVVLPAKRPGS